MTNNITSQDYNQVSQSSFHSIHHTFDIHLAQEYGVEEAILIHHFQHWIQLNMVKGINRHDDRTWTYQTIKDIADHFPYMTEDRIRELLEKLCKGKPRRTVNDEVEFEPVLIKGNYNKTKFDKTTWYAFKNEKMFTKGQLPSSTRQLPDSRWQKPKPIPDTKTQILDHNTLSVVDGHVRPPPLHEIKYKGKDAKENSINESEVLAYGIRTKKNWRIDEITYALNALAECKAVIYDVWRFIEGTIENHKRTLKGAFICKTTKTSSDSKSKESGIRSKSSEVVIEERVSPNSTFIPKTFREAFPDFPFGPRVLRTS